MCLSLPLAGQVSQLDAIWFGDVSPPGVLAKPPSPLCGPLSSPLAPLPGFLLPRLFLRLSPCCCGRTEPPASIRGSGWKGAGRLSAGHAAPPPPGGKGEGAGRLLHSSPALGFPAPSTDGGPGSAEVLAGPPSAARQPLAPSRPREPRRQPVPTLLPSLRQRFRGAWFSLPDAEGRLWRGLRAASASRDWAPKAALGVNGGNLPRGSSSPADLHPGAGVGRPDCVQGAGQWHRWAQGGHREELPPREACQRQPPSSCPPGASGHSVCSLLSGTPLSAEGGWLGSWRLCLWSAGLMSVAGLGLPGKRPPLSGQKRFGRLGGPR